MIEKLKVALKSTVIYGLGNLSVKLVGFILLPLYTKYLSVSDYGMLALLESVSQILIVMFSFKLSYGLLRWYWEPEHAQKQRSMFFTTLIFSFATSIGLFLISLPLTGMASASLFGQEGHADLLRLMVAFSALEIVLTIPSTLMLLQEKASLYVSTMVAKLAVNLAATVILLVYVSPTVESLYIAQLLGDVIYLIVLAPYITRNISFRVETRILRDMLGYSIPMILGAMSTVVLSFADRYILKYYGVLADVGIYSLGLKISNVILFVIMSIQLALTPIVYKMMNRPENKRFYSKILTYLSFGIMLLVIGMSVFGSELIKVLARNPDYWPAYKIIPIVSIAIFFGMLKDTTSTGLSITRRTFQMAIITAGMAVLNLLLDLVFIPSMQFLGAAIASLLTQIVFLIFNYVFSQRAYRIPYELAKIAKIVCVGVGLILIAELVKSQPLLIRLFVKSVLVLVYPVALYFLGFYEEIELTRLREAWNKWKHPSAWRTYLRESATEPNS